MKKVEVFLILTIYSVLCVAVFSDSTTYSGVTISGVRTFYNPSDVSTLAYWWAPESQMTTDATGTNTVSVWFDLKDSKNFITVAKSTQPQLLTNAANGYRVLRFDGTTQHMTNFAVASSFTGDDVPCWGFMVIRPFEASGVGAYTFGNSTNTASGQFINKPLQNGNAYRMTKIDDSSTTVNATTGATVVSNGWNFCAFSYSGTRVTLSINGVLSENSFNPGPTTIDTFTIGALFRNGAFAQAGRYDIAEIALGTNNVGTNVLNNLYLNYAKPKYALP